MKRNQADWIERMAASPFKAPMFTPQLQERVRERIIREQYDQSLRGRLRMKALWTGAICLVLLGGSIAWMSWPQELNGTLEQQGYAHAGDSEDWKVRQEYRKDGKSMFSVFPGGERIAGTNDGVLWIFERPLEEWKGSEWSVKAVHRDTGEERLVVPPMNVNESVRGTEDQTGIVTRFGLPYAGLWRLEVTVNDQYYGDAVIKLEDYPWNVSDQFDYEIYQLRGIEGRLAILDPGFIAGKPNKTLWYVWGSKDELDGTPQVIAIQQGTGRVETVIDVGELPEVYGDALEMPSLVMIPEPGLWRLTVLLGDQVFDSIVVEVKPD